MINLNDLAFEQLENEIINAGEPKFRAKQLFKWFSRGVTDFSEMTDIPKKSDLPSKYNLSTLQIYKKFVSKIDGTVKYLIQLNDGHLIESVAMRYKHGISVCISTEVGCPMGCKFCASTLGGKIRNLTSGEILGQVALLQRDLNERVSNIVLMGIGEPLDNYDNVITFLKNVNNENSMNIGYRHISLSTCGLVDKIYRLAEENMPITLSVSLHAPDDETRNKIMPVNKKYNIKELMAACREYINITGRRISYEYILIDGLNDSIEDAGNLAKLVKGTLAHINLIPANFVPESGFKKTPQNRVIAFKNELEKNHINATVRRELGSDIEASCGQLRRNEAKNRGDLSGN